MRSVREVSLPMLAFCTASVIVGTLAYRQSLPAAADEHALETRILHALEHGRVRQRSLILDGSVPYRPRAQAAAPVVIERQGFEGDFPPPGWQVLDMAARQDRVEARYKWGKETCEVEPLVGGSAAAWMAADGTEGKKLGCVTPYPANAKVNTWLSYVMDLTPYPMGLTVRMKLLLDQPLNERGAPTNMQIMIVDLETSEGIAYTISTPRPLSWLPLELPEEDLSVFGGRAQVAVIIAYEDNPAPGGHVGAVVDNVLFEGLPIEHTPTPLVRTASPTATQSPGRTPGPPQGAEVVFGTAVDPYTGQVTGQGRYFEAGVPQLCAKERWFRQAIGTDFRWQWYRNGSAVDLPGLNGQITLDTSEGFRYQCVSSPPQGTYEVQVYLAGNPSPAATGDAYVGSAAPTVTASPAPRTPPPTVTTSPTPRWQGSKTLYTPLGWRAIIPIPKICDGGFESGHFADCWHEGGELGRSVRPVDEGRPELGRYFALLGSPELGDGTRGPIRAGRAWIEQQIRLDGPAWPELAFDYRIISYDVLMGSSGTLWDTLDVLVEVADSPHLEFRAGNDTSQAGGKRYDSGWRSARIPLQAYQGLTANLRFEVWNRSYDSPMAHWNTWAYIDNVAIR